MKYGLYLAICLMTLLQFQTSFGQGTTLTFTTVFPTCNGAANGSATVQAIGGATPYTYKWSNGQTTQTAVNLVAGTYTVTVTTATNQTATGFTTLLQPAAVVANIVRSGFNCSTTGTLNVQASGGNGGPFTYSWSSGQNTANINVNTAGTYKVTVTDGAGCTATDEEIVLQNLVADVQTTNVLCNIGPANGKAIASAQGGKAPYTYLWNTGATTKSIQNLGQDTYTVTVTDANNCTSSDYGLVSKPSPILVTITINSPSCNGSNGSATLLATGGTAPYIYVWKSLNNALGATQNNLAPGPYLISIFDANGCEKEVTVKIPGQGGLAVQLALSKTECTGVDIGKATAIVTPSGTYNYSWNVQPNVNASQITGLAANTQVSVTVTNPSSGCSGTASGVIGVQHEIKVAVTDTDIACAADKNGTATAVASLGVAPYVYAWNYNNAFYANGANLNNLAIGTYTVTATDAKGCIATNTANISAQSNPTAAFQLSAIECSGSQINIQYLNQSTDPLSTLTSWVWTVKPDGSAPFVLNGATPPNMLFPEGQTGTVTLTVTSAKGCSATLTKPYKIASAPTFEVAIQAPGFTCDAQPVHIKVIGNPIYTYTWTPTQGLNLANAPFDVIANPSVTTQYILTVQSGQCVGKDTVLIKRSVPLNLQVASDSIVTCGPVATLSATANPAANATFQWFQGTTLIGTGPNVQVQAVGKVFYTVVATDENGCTGSKKVSVTGKGVTNINIQFDASGNICAQGPVTIKVTGSPAYTYVWTPNPTLNLAGAPFTVVANPVVTTTYFLSVSNGVCDSIFKVTIPRSNTPIGLAVSTNNQVTCDSISNIKATVTTTNAVTYQWFNSNGVVVDQDAILNVAAAGTHTYTVVATDINGCTESKIVTITGQGVEGVTLSAQNNGNDPCSASPVTITVTGNPDYTYNWTANPTLNIGNAPHTTVIANPLVTTTYFLTVVNGICSKNYQITIPRSNTPIGLAVSTDNQVTCDSISNIKATVTTTNAVTYQWFNSNGVVVDQDAILNVAAAGTHTYTVVATDINGCTESKIVTVTGQGIEGVTLSAQNNGNDPCSASPVTITVTGNPAYTYNWTANPTLNIGNAPHTTVIANPLVTTTYFLTVVNGICSKNYQITIPRSNTPIGLAVSTDNQVTCDSISNIKATVTTTNAVTYQWLNSNGVVVDQDAILNVAAIGTHTYTVVATDINGCTESKIVTVTGQGIEGVTLSAQNNGNDPCAALSVTITVTGNPAYTYNWTADPTLNIGNAPHTTVIANPSVTTTYFLTVVNGICSKNYQITIPRSNTTIGLAVSTNNQVTCDSISNIIATVTTTNAVTYQWLNSNGVVVDQDAILNVAAAGTHTYTVVATDINGCTESKVITVTGQGIEGVTLSAQNNGNDPCSASPVTITVTGNPAYTYNWTANPTLNIGNAPHTTVIANPLVTTTYFLTVVNDICSKNYQITIPRSSSPIGLQVSTDSLVTCDSISNIIATVTTTNAVTYQWLNSNGVVVDQDAILNLAAIGTHTYTVVATDINGCTESKIVTVTGQGIEGVTLSAQNNGNDPCLAAPVTITVIGNPAYTYNWTANPTLNIGNAPHTTVIANSLVTTTYFLTVVNGICSKNYQITIPRSSSPIGLQVSTDSLVTCDAISNIIATVTTLNAVTYQWLNSNGAVVDNDAVLNIATAGTNTYTVVATDINGCTEDKPVTITGYAIENVNISLIKGGINSCAPGTDTIKVTGPANYVYTWTPDATLNLANAPFTVLANPIVTTTYTLTVNNGICDSIFKITIARSNTPIGLQVSTDSLVTCDAISNIIATVTTTNAVTYQWFNSNGVVVDNDAVLNIATAGTHTYTVVATDINGCTEDKPVTITGYAIENVNISLIKGGINSCAPGTDTIKVTGPANYVYTWTPDATLNLANAPFTVLANPSVTTTYTLTVNNGICDSIFKITIARSNTPIGLQVSTDSLVTCDAISNIIATVTTTNAVTYQWFNSNGVVVDNDAVLNIATAGTHTYTVVATDVNGCTEDKKVKITGYAIENVDISVLSGGINACAPGTDTIKVTGPANYVYTWTPDATLNLANAPFIVLANPIVTTIYTLTINNGICDSIFKVTIQRATTTPIGLHLSIDNLVTCDSISNITATVTTTNAVTFQWLDNNGVVVDQDAILNVATAGTHTYMVVATDINGCTEAKPVTITGNGVENVSIQVQTNPNPCELKPIPITVTGSLTYTYNWTSDPTLNLSGAPFNVIANPTQSTTYTLQVNNGVCTRTYQIPVVVDYKPIDLKVSTKSIVTCAATASVTASVNASTTVTYQWLDSNGQVVDTDAVLNVASAGNHTYTVVATASNGCTQSESVQIQGNGIENVSLKIDAGANACDTLPVVIQVIGDPNNSYLWIPNATLDQSQGAPFKVIAHPKVTTTYKLQVSNLFCDSTFSVTIERKPPVDVSVSTEIENTCADISHITASSTADPNVTYQWISVETGLTVDNDALLNVASAGTHSYTLVVTNPATGCTATKTVTVNGQGVDIKLDTSLPDKECEGKQLPVCVINLDPNDNLDYNWTGTAGVNITPNNAACPMIMGPAGTYMLTVVATNQFNCKDTMQVPVEFEKSANLKGAISIDLCNRLKVKFFNTSGIPGTWQFGDNSPASTETNPLHTYANSGTYQVVFTPLQSGNCIAAYDTLLKVNATPPILANFSNTTANCLNNALIDFKDLSFHLNEIVNWNWSFPAGQPTSANTPNPSAQFSQNGNPLVTLIVTDTLGCSDTITKPLQIDLIPTLLEDSLKFCEGGSVQLNPDLSPGFQYVWSANPPDANLQVNAANPTVSPSVPTLYSVNVKNGLCSADFTVLVEPQPQATVNIAGVGKDTLLCTLDPITLSANSNNVNNLIWSNNPSFNPVLGTGATYTLQTTDPNYVLYVKSGLNGCDAIDSILVKNRAVRVDIGAYANQICKGSSTILNLINLSPSQNLTYTWSPELPSVANPVVAPSVKTNYAVTVSNAEGCTATATLPVDVLDLSVNATVIGSDTVKAGEFATLLATTTGTPGTVSYQWIPATGLSNPLGAQTQATPTEDSTVYIVIAQVDGRCPDTAQVIVYLRNDFCLEPYIFVPNAFTPNGDNSNDFFIVRFSDATELEFIVWDRWGEIVYQTTDINALGWDGSFKGKDATPDSYAWYVRIRCGSGNKYVKKGNVTLLK